MNLAAGTIVQRYTIEGILGRGAMGAVFRARHNQLGTSHAIKVLLMPSHAVRERLLQEGRIQAQLRHPNIVNVTDMIEVDGSPGLVMELIEGPSLDQLLRAVPLTLEQADDLAIGILAGVSEAHRRGMIHRDLKPANIMLETHTRGFVPKVTDFGLAKLLATDEGGVQLTRSGQVMGTPAYMSPEQIRNSKAVDARADVFSLGAILYELVAGKRAFPQEDIVEMFSAIASGHYVPIEDRVPDLPPYMADAIRGALMVDRDKRIATTEDLRARWTNSSPQPPMTISGPWTAAEILRVAPKPSQVPAVPTSRDSGTFQTDPPESATTINTDEAPLPGLGDMATLNTDEIAAEKPGAPVAAGSAPATRSIAPKTAAAPKPRSSRKSLPPPEPEDEAPARWHVALFGGLSVATLTVAGLGAIGLLATGIGVAWVASSDAEPELAAEPDLAGVAAPAVVAPAAVTAPAAPVETKAAVVSKPKTPKTTATAAPAAPEPAIVPAPPPPDAPVAPAPVVTTGTAEWSVRGDALTVELIGDDGTAHLPGTVPAGAYRIEATFPTKGTVPNAGAITLGADARAVVSCTKGFWTCKAQK